MEPLLSAMCTSKEAFLFLLLPLSSECSILLLQLLPHTGFV